MGERDDGVADDVEWAKSPRFQVFRDKLRTLAREKDALRPDGEIIQRRLAKEIGVGTMVVHDMWTGKGRPSKETREALAKASGKTLFYWTVAAGLVPVDEDADLSQEEYMFMAEALDFSREYGVREASARLAWLRAQPLAPLTTDEASAEPTEPEEPS